MSNAPIVRTLQKSQYSAQIVGDYSSTNFVALEMKSGKLGIFKLSDKDVYQDLGMTLTSTNIKFTGHYKNAD